MQEGSVLFTELVLYNFQIVRVNYLAKYFGAFVPNKQLRVDIDPIPRQIANRTEFQLLRILSRQSNSFNFLDWNLQRQ